MSNSNKLFVGNLAFSVGEQDLRTLFGKYGEVSSAAVPLDRTTNRSRGFAFVEMSSQAAAEAAIKGLDGFQYSGRDLKVNISQPRPRTNVY
jgi:cold-inducible RNA-binding protein